MANTARMMNALYLLAWFQMTANIRSFPVMSTSIGAVMGFGALYWFSLLI